MRAILALAVGFYASTALADDYGINWLVENMSGVQVQGSEALGLDSKAPLADVLDAITAEVNDNLFHIVNVDRCVLDYRGEGARCNLLLADRFLIRYRMQVKDGRYQVVSPANLIIKY